jgi:hypothetical protein
MKTKRTNRRIDQETREQHMGGTKKNITTDIERQIHRENRRPKKVRDEKK